MENQFLKYYNLELEVAKRDFAMAMDIGAYFEILKYVLMTATFVVLVLIFLHIFYGREEKKS